MNAFRITALSAFLFAFLGITMSSASAAQHRYAGPHPIPEAAPGVFCYIEAPHVHVYAPARVEVLYRDYDGWHHFVGDPTPYGYEGPRYAYHGAHPISMDARVEVQIEEPSPRYVTYCYLEGPHYHGFEPLVADFELKGEVYWYVGDYSPRFHEHRPRYAPINRVYASIEYERPVIVVEPPSAYIDILVTAGSVRGRGGPPPHARGGPPPHARARGHARGHVGGGLRVEVPVPTVEVRGSIGVGGGVRTGPPPRGHKKDKRGRGR
jgi:hypothetical protein